MNNLIQVNDRANGHIELSNPVEASTRAVSAIPDSVSINSETKGAVAVASGDQTAQAAQAKAGVGSPGTELEFAL